MARNRTLLFSKVRNRPLIFRRITGITPQEFNLIIKKINPVWKKKQSRKTKPGRPYQLRTVENQLFALLMYYRVYVTQEYIGWLFGADKATICRTIQRMAPLLAKVVAIKRAPHLSQEELAILLVDATEQRIQPPIRKQKRYYSGKKKCHTLKTEIITNKQGRIVSVSKTHPGKLHDLSVRKREKPLPATSILLGDSGYQGLQKLHANLIIPLKKSKKNPLSKGAKQFNRTLSKHRVAIENKFAEIKILN